MIEATSVIVCSRDRPQLLLETIQSVLYGDELPAEIVVVDQSRTVNKALAEWREERCPIRYIHSASAGLSRARNFAIEAASYDLIAIIDDDMFVERTWLATLMQALQAEGPRTVVTGRVLPEEEANRRGGFVPALVTSGEAARYSGRLARDVLAGGHMAAYRRTIQEVGGFDERLGAGSAFPAADDNDLGFRLLEKGCEIIYTPDAVVYHRAWRPRSEYLAMRWRYGRGKGGFYAKHLRSSARYMLGRIGRDLGKRAAAFPRRVGRDLRGVAGDVVYSCGVVIGVVQWILGLQKIK
jgi:GT2 family glycosyltransferase